MPGRHAPHLLQRHKEIPGSCVIIIYYSLNTNNVFGTLQSRRRGGECFKNAAPELNKAENARERRMAARRKHRLQPNELRDVKGPFQPRKFHDSILWNTHFRGRRGLEPSSSTCEGHVQPWPRALALYTGRRLQQNTSRFWGKKKAIKGEQWKSCKTGKGKRERPTARHR